jgi:nitroreductase
MTMDIEHLLTTTRSARKSLDLDALVDIDDIRKCLGVGLQAANGSNQQSWRWLVIADPALRGKLAELYRDAYLLRVGGQMLGDLVPAASPQGRLTSSTEWLVENLANVPLLVIPCYQPYLPRIDGDESFYRATLYGSIFPAVWNFQLALHACGYGTCITTLHLHHGDAVAELLQIPEDHVQGCLLPVARLRAGHRFRPARRRPLDEVVAVDRWGGPPL